MQDVPRNDGVNADKWVTDYSTDTTPLRSDTPSRSRYDLAPTPTSTTYTQSRPHHHDDMLVQVRV
jgi:hypothetical protein